MKLHHCPGSAEASGNWRGSVSASLLMVTDFSQALHVAFIIRSAIIPNPEEQIFRLFEKDRIGMDIGVLRSVRTPATLQAFDRKIAAPFQRQTVREASRGLWGIYRFDISPNPMQYRLFTACPAGLDPECAVKFY